MGELATEARVEVWSWDGWTRLISSVVGVGLADAMGPRLPEVMPIPQAVVEARAAVRFERMRSRKPSPIRVVDSAGTVVEQWGRP